MSSKILIADDEPNILVSLEFLMKREGFDVSVARDGVEALAAIREQQPELVLLDVMMPGSLDGYQVCQKIRQEPGLCNIPVILLTARGQQADFEMGRQAGADAYLTKPFSPLELIDTVDSQLARTVGAHA